MDEQRKYAYRLLLYRATLDIRPITWFSLSWNPLAWSRDIRRIRRAGAIAEWVHNLAFFSALDFRGFEEARFWEDFGWLRKRHPKADPNLYRLWFDQALSETDTPTSG